ncbi:MAG TPA: hypothetical protein VKI19_00075, partial [Acidimicrobiales bacterium]|nr:hypothetical protein [Acidimicrobiales bacterium]
MTSISTQGLWLGPPDRPLAGWVTSPDAGPASGTGVLLLPAAGYEYWTSHATLRATAEALGEAGHVALRLDFDGTGDSAGDQTDPDGWARWRGSVRPAVEQL